MKHSVLMFITTASEQACAAAMTAALFYQETHIILMPSAHSILEATPQEYIYQYQEVEATFYTMGGPTSSSYLDITPINALNIPDMLRRADTVLRY